MKRRTWLIGAAATAGVVVIAIAMPLAGVVFVLDGVLIGAGDGRFLAWAGVVSLVAYLPFVLAVRQLAPRGAGHESEALVWLWVAYGGFMLARMLTLVLRVRSDAWIRTGADLT